MHAGPLTWDEKMTPARWIDLEDDRRPTLWISPTVSEARKGPVSAIAVGAYDLESGLASGALSMTFNVAIGGQPAGTNFAAGINPGNGQPVSVPLPAAVNRAAIKAVVTASIKDAAGNVAQVVRTFQ